MGGVILGDINGDGYADLITMKGTYWGGTVIDSIVDVGITSGSCSPPRCTAVGEFNNDVYKDVLGAITTVGGGRPGFIWEVILQTMFKIGIIPTTR